MQEYKNAKVLLMQTDSKPTDTTIKKWAQIAVDTEDTEFSARCEEYANHLRSLPPFSERFGWKPHPKPITVRGVAYRNIDGWNEIKVLLRDELYAYVTNCIATKKPAWQVTAERHGWRPTR